MLTEDTPTGSYSDLDRWSPFVASSIKIEHPEFESVLLEELTLEELTQTWNNIIRISGIKVVINKKDKSDEGGGSNNEVEWSEIYGRITTATGVSFRDIDEYILEEVEDLLEYLNRHPTAAEIMSAVHGVKPRGKRVRFAKDISEAEFNNQLGADQGLIAGTLGPAGVAPEDMREGIRWAEDQLKKIRGGNA